MVVWFGILSSLPVRFFQGDRGYEGPKGSRGPPGVGYKGDKVWLGVKHGWDIQTVKTCDAVKNDLSDPSSVWSSGKHRSPWAARFSGVSRGRHPRRKGKANANIRNLLPLNILYFCNHILNSLFFSLALGRPRTVWAVWSQRTYWTGYNWTKGW